MELEFYLSIPSTDVFNAALLSKPLPKEEFDQLLNSGAILNNPLGKCVPQLSIFQLFCYGESNFPQLRDLCLMEIRQGKNRQSLGYQFEQHHAQWKCVFAIARGLWKGTLSAYYNEGIVFLCIAVYIFK